MADQNRCFGYILALQEALEQERAKVAPEVLTKLKEELAASESSRGAMAKEQELLNDKIQDLRQRLLGFERLLQQEERKFKEAREQYEGDRDRFVRDKKALEEVRAGLEAEKAFLADRAQEREREIAEFPAKLAEAEVKGQADYRDSDDFKVDAVKFCTVEMEATLLNIVEELHLEYGNAIDFAKSPTLAPFAERYFNLPEESDEDPPIVNLPAAGLQGSDPPTEEPSTTGLLDSALADAPDSALSDAPDSSKDQV